MHDVVVEQLQRLRAEGDGQVRIAVEMAGIGRDAELVLELADADAARRHVQHLLQRRGPLRRSGQRQQLVEFGDQPQGLRMAVDQRQIAAGMDLRLAA